MTVAHGQLGLRIGRPFRDLVSESSHSRRPYLDLQLGQAIEGGGNWVADGSNQKTTITAASLTYAGVIRAVVGVQSMVAPRPLVRVERIADMVAGTWYYDDDALVAGGSTDLYVRLPGSVDPDTTTVVLLLLFTFGTVGEVHPILGPEKQANAKLNAFTAGVPDGWNLQNVGASGVAITQETVDVFEGTGAITITPGASGLAAGTNGGINAQPKVGVAGAVYLVSSAYQTDPFIPSGLSARLRARLGPAGDSMLEDGRGQTTDAAGVALPNTGGAWWRATFLFRCPTDLTTLIASPRLHNASVGAITGGYVRFDDFHFHRVWRNSYYAPLLDSASIPELEIMSSSILFGQRSLGIGNVGLLDGDGSLTRAMANLLYFDKPAMVYVGGAFATGEEVTRDDWRIAFPALTRDADFRHGEVKIDLEDSLTLSRIKVAQATHRKLDQPNMEKSKEGLPKGLLFGVTEENIIEPVRVALSSNGFGVYDRFDPTVPVAEAVPTELAATPSIKVYPNKELADQDLQGYLITDTTNDFIFSNQNTRVTVLRDIRNRQFDRAGDDVGTGAAFTFEYLGAVLTAVLDISGPGYKVAADLQAAMRAIAGGVTTIAVTLDEGAGANPHKYSVAKTGGVVGTFNLYMEIATAAKANVPGWEILGFDLRTDRTGTGATVTHVGDKATFTDPDKDHVLRLNGGGMMDDAAGSICGVASASLNTPPAMASWLLQKVMKIPPAEVDVPSFKVTRDACVVDFTLLFSHLAKGEDDAYGALAWLCQMGLMTLNVGADRIWRAAKYAPGTAGARSFNDSDYLSFRMWNDPAAIFKEVRIWGAYHPARGEFRTYAAPAGMDTGIPVKYGAEGIFELFGYLDETVITGGLSLVQNYYGKLIEAVPRCVEFEATGKLVDLSYGDKVILSATGPGVLDPTGVLDEVAFRVFRLKHNYLGGSSLCFCVEDVELI